MTLAMPRLMCVAFFHFNLFCVWYIKRSCLGNFYTFYEKYPNGDVCFREDNLGLFSVHTLYENILFQEHLTETSTQKLEVS